MLRTLLPSQLRARRAAAALVGLALSAAGACSDAPSAPAAPRATGVEAAVARPGASLGATAGFFAGDSVVYRATVGTSPTTLVAGVRMRFADTSFVVDNSARDLNKADGVIEAKLPVSASDRAELALASFDPYAAVDAGARWGETSEDGVIDFGHFNVVKKPTLRIRFLTKYKAPAPGATVTLAYGNAQQTLVDGKYDAADGVVETIISQPATVTVCETSAPPGYAMAKPACQSIALTWAQNGTLTFLHDVGIRGQQPPAGS